MDTSNAITLTITAAPGVPPPPPGTIPAWATALVPGQCTAISLNTLASVWEGNPPAGGGTIYKAAQAWNSGVDAPLLGQYGSKLFAGGGDSDSWETSVFAFDYGTQLWSRIKDRTKALSWNPDADRARPATDPQYWNSTYSEHGDGTPGAPHTYDLIEYVPPAGGGGSQGALVYPVTRFAYPRDVSNWAHTFTLADKQWKRAGKVAGMARADALGMCAYDPVAKRVWMLPSTSTGVWVGAVEWLDLLTGDRGADGIGKDYVVKSGTLRVWQRSGKRYLIWAGVGGLNLLDLDNLGAGIVNKIAGGFWDGFGFTEAAALGCFYATSYNASSSIVKIIPPAGDPLTGTWTTESITMGGVTPTGTTNGIWKRLQWVDSLRCLTWWYEAGGSVYAYRPMGT